jgi:hypothetical protein
MRKIKSTLFKTIAVIAFTGLTIAGTVGTGRAAAGYGGQENPGATDTINDNSGSGTGGSTGTGTTDTTPSYREDQTTGSDSGSGSGTGGSTDTGTSTGGAGTGPNYGTAPLGGPSGDGMGDTRPEK